MSELETSIVMIMNVFDKYACIEGKKDTLTKAEMKTMLEKELPGILGNAKDKDACGKLLHDLDINGDEEMDFQEFVVMVAAVTCMGHERFACKPHKK